MSKLKQVQQKVDELSGYWWRVKTLINILTDYKTFINQTAGSTTVNERLRVVNEKIQGLQAALGNLAVSVSFDQLEQEAILKEIKREIAEAEAQQKDVAAAEKQRQIDAMGKLPNGEVLTCDDKPPF